MTKIKEIATTEVAKQNRECSTVRVRMAKTRPSRTKKRVSMTAKLKEKIRQESLEKKKLESMFKFKVGQVVKAPYVIP